MKDVRIYEYRQTNGVGNVEIIYSVHCRDAHVGGMYEASVVVLARDATSERVAGIKSHLRQAYLDHRGQKH